MNEVGPRIEDKIDTEREWRARTGHDAGAASLALAKLGNSAVLGDAANYSVGRYVGPRVFSAHDGQTFWHRILNHDHLDKAHAFFEKYGGKAVVIGRFVPIVRTFVPFVAGKLEQLMLVNLVDLFRAEAAYAKDWIVKNL